MTFAPKIAKDIEGVKSMLHYEGFARIEKSRKNSLKAQAQRYKYRWSFVKDGRYYIVRVIK